MHIWRIEGKVLRHCGISIGFVKIVKEDFEYAIYNADGVVATIELDKNYIVDDGGVIVDEADNHN